MDMNQTLNRMVLKNAAIVLNNGTDFSLERQLEKLEWSYGTFVEHNPVAARRFAESHIESDEFLDCVNSYHYSRK